MVTLPHPRVSSPRLTAPEREIILNIADDEQSWHVHTDSRRAASSRLLGVAQALGIVPKKQGGGWAFDLPLAAISFRVPKPASPAQREALRHARLRSREPVATGDLEVPAAGRVSLTLPASPNLRKLRLDRPVEGKVAILAGGREAG